MRSFLPLVFYLVVCSFIVAAQEEQIVSELIGESISITVDLDYSPSFYDTSWITADQNSDGTVDYAMLVSEETQMRLFESIDSNFDKLMDDFYIYSNDVLIRREIDQNYDGAVDLIVFLFEGVYVEKYYRDQSYDGIIDQVRIFSE
jgi:hypothetical protein